MVARILITCVLCGFLSPLLIGCDPESRNATPHPVNGENQVLRRGNGGEPDTLDPSRAEDVHAFNVLYDLYEGLVIEGPDGALLPGAAESWDISDHGRRYTFHLRADSRWSNGEPVVAADFVAGITRSVSPDTTSPYSYLLAPISNAANVIEGRVPADELGIRAENSRTLVIELTSSASHFLGILAMPVSFPLYGSGDFDVAQFHKPNRFVGNGPYVLEKWLPLERIRLSKNQNYWGADKVAVSTVDYYPIDNPNTELSMYRAGELDMTATVPTGRIAALRDERPDELQISPTLALYYLAFDLTEPPLENAKLRRALSMAIDRRTLVELLARGEQPAFGIVPPGVTGHEPARYAWQSLSDTDREALAESYYTEAGYSTDNPLELKLTYDTGDIHEKVALAVSAMWNSVLGAEIALEKKEWKYFLSTRDDRAAWQVMRFAWFGDYNDATTFTDIFRIGSPQNLSAYKGPEYERLLAAAELADTNQARMRLLTSAERRLLDDYPIVPLYFLVSKHLVSPRVRNFEPNVLDRHASQFLGLVDEAADDL